MDQSLALRADTPKEIKEEWNRYMDWFSRGFEKEPFVGQLPIYFSDIYKIFGDPDTSLIK